MRRWLLIGVLTKLVGSAIFTGVYSASQNVIVSNGVVVCLTPVLSYISHRSWTFKGREHRSGSLRRYVSLIIVGLVLDSLLTHFLMGQIGNVFLSKFLSTTSLTALSFLIMDKFVFARKERSEFE